MGKRVGIVGAGVTPFTNFVEGCMRTVGAFAFTCVAADGIAPQDVSRIPGLIQAIALALGILSVVSFYITIVAEKATASDWVTSALLIVLFVTLPALCPWRQTQT